MRRNKNQISNFMNWFYYHEYIVNIVKSVLTGHRLYMFASVRYTVCFREMSAFQCICFAQIPLYIMAVYHQMFGVNVGYTVLLREGLIQKTLLVLLSCENFGLILVLFFRVWSYISNLSSKFTISINFSGMLMYLTLILVISITRSFFIRKLFRGLGLNFLKFFGHFRAKTFLKLS